MVRVKGLVGMVRVSGWGLYYVYESPLKERSKRMLCVRVCVKSA